MASHLQLGPNHGSREFEVLDLRHFSAAQLGPLLRDEAAKWQMRLDWDYTQSVNLLLEYLDSRILPGFVALDGNRRLLGYCFAVLEGVKAVVGDIYAFGEATCDSYGEAASGANPVCATLARHLLEMLQATPGVGRLESQMLMFPAGTLSAPFLSRGFRSFERLFMLAELKTFASSAAALDQDSGLRLEHWRPEHLNEAAELIYNCYLGHEDSQINDQYQSVAGAGRFLHNIIRFPGCGLFDAESSLLLRDTGTDRLQAILLCSRVRADVAHITQLCVSPDVRGVGHGRFLLSQAAQGLQRRGFRALSLTVTADNQPARRLYESVGFKSLHHFEAMTWDKS
jgi:ribosomal protein S18 acetylase RimI-like enzyme